MKEPVADGKQTTAARAGTFSLELLQHVYQAFTATTLVEDPLVDAFCILDGCMSSIDWESQTSDRDAFLHYFEDNQNQDFVPSMINILGVSWDQNFLPLLVQATRSVRNLVKCLATARSTVVTAIANTLVDQQMKVVYRILSSGRLEQIVSSIQLLTQLVTSGGTPIADMLYRLAVSEFNAWPKLLSRKGSMREKEISRTAKSRRLSHTSGVRPYAIEFLIALIGNSSSASKESILTNRLLMSPIIKFLPLDSNATVHDFVRCVYSHVLLDKFLPRNVKASVFNTENMLFKIISMHGQAEGSPKDQAARDDLLRQFLLEACTTYGNGVCYQDRGWYPPSMREDQDVGFQVYNGLLLRFITQLRPLEIVFHREILVAILRKCADLRGPYLASMSTNVRADLSFMFISQVVLQQEIISLPLPAPFTTNPNLPDSPPPTKVVVENLLPTIINETYILQARNHDSRLVRYALSQLLFAVLTKLNELQEATKMGGDTWYAFSEEILAIAHKRLREASSIVKAYTECLDSPLLSICYLKVLLCYGEVFSGIHSLGIKSLGETLRSEWTITTTIDLLQRMLLLRLTEQIGEITWWTRQSGGKTLLALLLDKRMSIEWVSARHQLDSAVEKLLDRSNAFQSVTIVPSQSQLFLSLDSSKDDNARVQIYPALSFIDESLSQFMLKQNSFIDKALSLGLRNELNSTLSLSVLAFRHQWRMLKDKANMNVISAVSRWLIDFLVRLYYVGENPDILSAFVEDIENGHPKTRSNPVRQGEWLWNRRPGYSRVLPPKFRKWQEVCDSSISEIVMYLESNELDKAFRPLVSRARVSEVPVSSFAIVCILRRVVNLRLSAESDLETQALAWFNLLIEFLSLQQQTALTEFIQSKRSICQLYTAIMSGSTGNPVEMSKLINDFSIIISRFYTFDDGALLKGALKPMNERLPGVIQISLPCATSIIERLSPRWDTHQRTRILSGLFSEFSNIELSISNASYITTCLESVIALSGSNILCQLSAENIRFLIEVGYIAQSTIIPKIILNWIDESPHVAPQFLNVILSCGFMRNSSFTPFEATLLTPLAIRFDTFGEEMSQKLTSSVIDLDMLMTALDIASKLKTVEFKENQSTMLVSSALRKVFTRGEEIVGHIFDVEDISDRSWELVSDFVLYSSDIDAEEWLGKVCKHDMENLNPKAGKVVNNILRKDSAAFHRLLPGWLYRACSRFTRRFAEDPILSTATLASVASFDCLLGTMNAVEGFRDMFEGKASYIETMLQAAIIHQLQSVAVSALVRTVLSVMKPLRSLLNEAHLLQSVLGMKWLDTPNDTFANIATIIHQLYFMNPLRNSNHSVLIGVLGVYSGSTNPTDLLFMEIIKSIDEHQSLSLVSSLETWNAFRNHWSHSHVQSLSSSLENPFPLIDAEEMQGSILRFATKCNGGQRLQRSYMKSAFESKLLMDPEFWLPVIAYCLDRCKHSSELTVLLENSSIGFAFICLSSASKEVRKMAGLILLKWEQLCEVHRLRERGQMRALIGVVRNSEGSGRLPKLITLFLGECLPILMEPKHILYEKVNSFLLQRPSLDLNDIPMFYSLSNTGEHFDAEVDWLFTIITASLDDDMVAPSVKRRHVVEFCFGLYRARTGRTKVGKSQLPRRVQDFLIKMFQSGYLTELFAKYGFSAWLRQEIAFGDSPGGDTVKAFPAQVDVAKQEIANMSPERPFL